MADWASVALGGIFALAGAYLTPFIQSRERARQDVRADRALLRSKAEELFPLIANVRATSEQTIRNAFLSGTREPYSEYHQILSIVSIYFPELRNTVESSRKILGKKIDDTTIGAGETEQAYLTRLARIAGEELGRFCSDIEDGIVQAIATRRIAPQT